MSSTSSPGQTVGGDAAAGDPETGAGEDDENEAETSDGSAAGNAEAGELDAKQLAAKSISDLKEVDAPAGLSRADVNAAVFEVPNDGEIEEIFGIDRWTFEGKAGQLLGVDILDIEHDCRQDLDLVLENPSGDRGHVEWIGNGSCRGQGPLRLEETGTYVIEFSGGEGGVIDANTGTYRFVPYILTERDVNPATFDVPNDGEIKELFGVDRWTFDAKEGDLFTVDVLDIDHSCRQDLYMTIEDPFGEREDDTWIGNGGCQAYGPIEIEETGTYVLEFFGGAGGPIPDSTGTYRFIPRFLTERDDQAASFGTPTMGEIEQVFGVDRWTFEADGGELLTVDVPSIDHDCRQDLYLTIEDPFGEREEVAWIGNGGCKGYGPFELERPGNYTVEFSGGHGGLIKDKTGVYTFTLALS